MKKFKAFIFSVIIATYSVLSIPHEEGIEIYGPDYIETRDYHTGPAAINS